MSFRNLTKFTEIMRVLGYPRLLSLSNFRVPNFFLVAEILIWLVRRFEPDVDLPSDHDSEQERVALIRRVAEFMALKTSVKLNTRKLYQADGYAVQEMLKIASLLYEAQTTSANDDVVSGDSRLLQNFDIADKIHELKNTRKLASQLTVNGATLFDLLGREVEMSTMRNSKVARQYDTVEIEAALTEFIESTRKEIDDTKKQIHNVKDNEENLEARIERRRTELERNQKRLQTLKKVRPAFMEEFEKLEIELRSIYDDYLQKCRYLTYLEHLYEDAAKAEQERFERRQTVTKKQLEQLRAEDANFESIMEGNDSIFATNLQDPLTLGEVEKRATEKDAGVRQKQETAARSSRVQISNQRRIYGSMSGRQRGPIREANDSGGSLDSDSDFLIDGDFDDDDDEDDDDDDDDEDDDVLMNPVLAHEVATFDVESDPEKRSIGKIEHSDEDF